MLVSMPKYFAVFTIKLIIIGLTQNIPNEYLLNKLIIYFD